MPRVPYVPGELGIALDWRSYNGGLICYIVLENQDAVAPVILSHHLNALADAHIVLLRQAIQALPNSTTIPKPVVFVAQLGNYSLLSIANPRYGEQIRQIATRGRYKSIGEIIVISRGANPTLFNWSATRIRGDIPDPIEFHEALEAGELAARQRIDSFNAAIPTREKGRHTGS